MSAVKEEVAVTLESLFAPVGLLSHPVISTQPVIILRHRTRSFILQPSGVFFFERVNNRQQVVLLGRLPFLGALLKNGSFGTTTSKVLHQEEGVGFWIRVTSSDNLLKVLEALKYMCTLSHHIWTPARALTDKSERRLTAVTCWSITKHLGERSAASSAGETSLPQIHMNAHYGCWCKNICSVLVAVMKAPSEPETKTPRWCHLGKKTLQVFHWWLVLKRWEKRAMELQYPGRSMQNGPVTTAEGRRGRLHFCTSGQRLAEKRKYTCFQWLYYKRLAAGRFKHEWVQNSLVLINAWSQPHRNPCWVQMFLSLIHLWLKGNINTCSWDTQTQRKLLKKKQPFFRGFCVLDSGLLIAMHTCPSWRWQNKLPWF